jgi:hypothetical protein
VLYFAPRHILLLKIEEENGARKRRIIRGYPQKKAFEGGARRPDAL